jgi:NDP-sugar pyrophosphorylase family protein
MQVVILVGGLGTRLRPLTYTTPKSLLPIADVRFLELECQWLRANGASDVVLAVSHFATAIVDFLKKCEAAHGLGIKIRTEEEPLGSGGALKNCADVLQDDFVLLNGDILTDLDLSKLVEFHRKCDAVVTATVSEVEDPRHWGILDVQEDGRTLGWQEKPTKEEAKSSWGNVGAWAMSKELIELIPEGCFVSLEKETFPMIFQRGMPFYAFRFPGYWMDIGTVEKYVQANRDLLMGAVRGLTPNGRVKEKGVWIDDSARVAADARFAPPVVVGPGSLVGTGTQVYGPTVVGSGARIGAGAEIRSTIVWPQASISDGVKACDSVIGEAHIGADCTLGPGCTIAANSVVAAGTDLPADTVLGPGSRIAGR